MAKQTINIGTAANDGTGDPLRTAFDKINDNFTELYGGDDEAANYVIEDTTPQLGGDLDVNGRRIVSARSNEDIILLPNGTGGVVASGIRMAGTTLSADDSSSININEGLIVDGTASVSGAATLSSTLAVTGAATLSSTLAVTGATTMSAGLTATSLTTNTISANGSNADLSIQPSGTGDVLISALRINGTTLDSSDSTAVTIAEAVDVTGALTGTSASFSTTLGVTGATTLSGGATVNGAVTAGSVSTNAISSNGSNADISIQPSGTGNVVVGALTLNGTAISAADSTLIQLNEAVNISGALDVAGAMTTIGQTITGNVSVSGSLTTGTFAVGDLNITADGSITSDSNGDIVIDPAGTGAIVLTGPITATGTQTTTGQLNVDELRLDGNTISAPSSGGITLTPAAGQNVAVSGTNTKLTAGEANFTVCEATTLRADAIQNDTSDGDLAISTQGSGAVTVASQLTLTGSFKPAIHTFTATDAITETEHSGRTLLLGEVGGNANVVLTLPDATGSGNIYHFIVSVAMGGSTTYKIQVADADNTMSGQMMYLDEDGTAVTSFPTVAASDTITLNSGTQGGLIGDTLTLIDIATDKYAVFGQMRVSAGANPATPFSAAVS
ncbi:MAG: hypothetical protein CBD62_00590 [Candidatus Pelagibacter sp. TMED202]|nr:MAG: hypothetical protein CBD62_00590 [Candidatus Pelagibacter sp. TMED202]|tara:strand:- start:5711 stop:7561 length:1851 start_codon:yes stop_codon:yes gene_type:complete